MTGSFLWLVLVVLSAAGHAERLKVNAPDPNERLEVLLNQSENSGPMCIPGWINWFPAQPAHLTYQRVDGGIGP